MSGVGARQGRSTPAGRAHSEERVPTRERGRPRRGGGAVSPAAE